MIIKLENTENLDILDLYRNAAIAIGFHIDEETQFDCTKIDIAKNIQDNIYEYYKSLGVDTVSITMLLATSGPKVSEDLDDNMVNIYNGFVIRS